jgi:hypothetical protein
MIWTGNALSIKIGSLNFLKLVAMNQRNTAPGWVVEVFSDGLSVRHRRFIVAATDRDAAIALVKSKLGEDIVVTSSSKIDARAYGIANIPLGEMVPL